MVVIIVTVLLILATILLAIFGSKFLAKFVGAYRANRAINRKGLALLSFVWLIIPLGASITKIDANEVGVIYNEVRSGVQEKTYGEGVHLKSVFEQIIPISTVNRETKMETTGQTSDGQYVLFEISLIYKIQAKDAGLFYRATGTTNISNEAINTLVKQTLQKETIKYNIFELLSEQLEIARAGFEAELTTTVYSKYAITIVAVSFDDVDGGTEVEQILKDLAKAEQEIEIARKAADAKLIAAEADAEAEKLLAEAAAFAIEIQGEASGVAASAYINSVMDLIDEMHTELAGALTYPEVTDLILGVIFYNVWDGKLPQVLTSDSLSALIAALIAG